jgi:hypothetical protein
MIHQRSLQAVHWMGLHAHASRQANQPSGLPPSQQASGRLGAQPAMGGVA